MINPNAHINLQRDEYGIYYIYQYIPQRWFDRYSDEAVELSRRIWAYKEGDEDTFETFTYDRSNGCEKDNGSG